MRSRDESGGSRVYWAGGVRHRGGAILFCGFCMERGKAGSDTGTRWLSLMGGRWRVARGSAPGDRNREVLSTDAEPAGGPARSSAETPVMGEGGRGRVI